ncbi:DUF3108 domain-containing protein [Accumulibacter sp.]|uniref:DUF3108 domain-containing protein n=1 Tax=Accumulibacter sp. TaxID=2053492 RepID=UPI0025FBDD22|nr:DUF3108 domain-containing protein [Accumulibacter sp.]MCM8614151.1 DUF3108 domain-containing protein [Accumulibacter sp.]MCM8637918.1 DUF3108 domain-containing protein [Accumulibacter sp.]MCM8641387.1 DUF3108 domain-containing protein [Accumulibacter sp.]
MPALLILALAASLGLHTVVLFVPEVDLSFPVEPPPLSAELKPQVATQPVRATAPATPLAAPPPPARKRRPPAASGRPPESTRRATADASPAAPEPSPEAAAAEGNGAAEAMAEPEAMEPDAGPAPDAPTLAASSLPRRGIIRYRVDRGDQGFQIGHAVHSWQAGDGVYRITAVTETSGLIGFFRPLRVEAESVGRVTAGGLQPERFVTRQSGRERNEQADFDWQQLQVRFADRQAQTLSPGAQDLLSLNYQLGLLGGLATGQELAVVTGRKHARHRLEVLPDEEVETPAGRFNGLHLRVSGVASTEVWLARERGLLPVKIRYVDRRGNLYVQVAIAIEVGEEP